MRSIPDASGGTCAGPLSSTGSLGRAPCGGGLPREPSAPKPAKPDVPPQEPGPKEPVEDKGPAHVPPDASGIDLTTLETKNLDLLYFDPIQTYLTPYIARSFENALAFHERMFNWKPWERTTLLLKDFSDYANAGARASPNNAVLIDVAPLSISMETFTPGERSSQSPTMSLPTSPRWTCGISGMQGGAASSGASPCRSRSIRSSSSTTFSPLRA